MIGALATLFFPNHSVQLKSQCNWAVDCNWTPVIRQLKLPITELITITIATITYPKQKLVNFQNGGTTSLPVMFVLIIHIYIFIVFLEGTVTNLAI